MGRALVVIRNDADRVKASSWCSKSPAGTQIEFRRNKRTLAQNNLMWSLLTQVADHIVWYGVKLSPQDWKDVMTASLRKARVVPGIDPGSFVVLGLHTSGMDKDEMQLLLALISAFGAEHGVVFREEPPLSVDQRQTSEEVS